MAHIWGYCKTNNCKLGYPKLSGVDIGRSETNSDPKNDDCEDKNV